MSQQHGTVNRTSTVGFGHNSGEQEHVAASKKSAYYALAFQWISRAQVDERIENRHRAILIMLGYHVDPDIWGCWLGYSGLAGLTGYSVQTVERTLRDLVSWGYIRRRQEVIESAQADRPLTVFYFPRISTEELETAILEYRSRTLQKGQSMKAVRNAHVPERPRSDERNAQVPKRNAHVPQIPERPRSKNSERPRSDRIYYKDDIIIPSGDERREAPASATDLVIENDRIVGPNFEVDLKAVDMAAALAVMPVETCRAIAEICARDWLANKKAPNSPMATIRRAIAEAKNSDAIQSVRIAKVQGDKPTAGLTRMQVLERKARGML